MNARGRYHNDLEGGLQPREADLFPEAVAARDGGRTFPSLRAVQQGLGNAALGRLLNGTGSGESLDTETNRRMAATFGRDFADVRLHRDSAAAMLTRALGAKAVTSGHDVFFAPGAYDTGSREGVGTLAHELTHVAQAPSAGELAGFVSTPGDEAEIEAGAAAEAAVSGAAARPAARRTAVLLRQEEGGAAQPAAFDQVMASLEIAVRGSYASLPSRDLIQRVGALQRDISWRAAPRRSLEIMRSLVEIYQTLTARVGVEPPFTYGRPDITVTREMLTQAPFEGAEYWVDVATLHEAEQRQRQEGQGRQAPRRAAGRSRSRGGGGVTLPNPPAVIEVPAAPVSVSPAEAEPAEAGEPAAADRSEVGGTVALLNSILLRDIREQRGQPMPPDHPHYNWTLADAVGHIVLIGPRIYLLGRDGRIQSSADFVTELALTSLEPGRYLVFPARVSEESPQTGVFVGRLQGRGLVEGGSTGDFVPRHLLNAQMDLIGPLRQDLGADLGFVMVASTSTRAAPGSPIEVTGRWQNLAYAIRHAPSYMTWALEQTIDGIMRQLEGLANLDPDAVGSFALNEALGFIGRYLPEVSVGMRLYHIMRTAGWLGQTASIAYYASTADEVEIASQAIARRAMEEIVDRVIDHFRALAGEAVGAVRTRRANEAAARGEIRHQEPEEISPEVGRRYVRESEERQQAAEEQAIAASDRRRARAAAAPSGEQAAPAAAPAAPRPAEAAPAPVAAQPAAPPPAAGPAEAAPPRSARPAAEGEGPAAVPDAEARRAREAAPAGEGTPGAMTSAQAESSMSAARRLVATASQGTGSFDRAVSAFQRILDTPGISDVVRKECLHRLGFCYLQMERYDQAIDYFERSLAETGPVTLPTRMYLQEAREAAGRTSGVAARRESAEAPPVRRRGVGQEPSVTPPPAPGSPTRGRRGETVRPVTDEDADLDWPTAVRPRPRTRPAGEAEAEETTEVSRRPREAEEEIPTVVEDRGIEPAPEGLVHIVGPSEAEARVSFRRSLEEDPSREAAIFYDPAERDYIVVQGGPGMVETEWLGRGGEFRGRRWRLIEHNHPGSDVLARFASPEDFEAMMHFQNLGIEPPGAVTTRVLWHDPATGEELHTEIGYDPELPEPFWIRYRDPHGDWQVEMFGDVPWNPGSAYQALLRRFGFVPRAITPRLEARPRARPPAPPGTRQGGGR